MDSRVEALHAPARAAATLRTIVTTVVLAVVVTAGWPLPVTADERGDYRRPARDPAWQHGGYSFPGSRAGSFRQRGGHADRDGAGVARHHGNQHRGRETYRGRGYGDGDRGRATTSFSRRSSDLQGYSRRPPPPALTRSGPGPGNSGAAQPGSSRGYGERGYEYRGFDRRYQGRHQGRLQGERRSGGAPSNHGRGRD